MGSELKNLAHEVAARDAAWPVLPIVMADTQTGEIVYASKFAAAIFGYEPEELVGGNIENLVPMELRTAHAMWRKDVQTPKTRLMGVGRQVMGVRKDGSLLPVHVSLTAVESLGRGIGVAFVTDLTGVIMSHNATEAKGA